MATALAKPSIKSTSTGTSPKQQGHQSHRHPQSKLYELLGIVMFLILLPTLLLVRFPLNEFVSNEEEKVVGATTATLERTSSPQLMAADFASNNTTTSTTTRSSSSRQKEDVTTTGMNTTKNSTNDENQTSNGNSPDG
jgi:cytoskeletal protein RodZ